MRPLHPTLRASLPNLLSGARILLAPIVLVATMGLGPVGYFGTLALALATEIDGTVARRLGAESEAGRRLDSLADLFLQLFAIAGFMVLYPDLVRENRPYLIIGGTALVAPVIFGFLTRGEPLGYHSWLARGAGVLGGVAVIAFLLLRTMAVMRLCAVTEVAVALEYFAIAAILPDHRGVVQSLWHARALRAGAARNNEELIQSS